MCRGIYYEICDTAVVCSSSGVRLKSGRGEDISVT